mgnify:FL=1
MALVIRGSSSGQVTVDVPAAAGTNTLTIPASTGEMLTTVSTSSNVIPTINNATAVATTSGTAVDFTSIPSGVKKITVLFNQVKTSAAGLRFIQIGTSGGLVTSGYISAGAYAGPATAGAQSTAGFIIGAGGATADKTVGTATIQTLGSNTWVFSATVSDGVASYAKMGGGSITLGAVLDRIRVTNVAGQTFDHGSVNIAWEY